MSDEPRKQQSKRHHNLIRSYGLLWDRKKVQWKGREAGLPGRIRVKTGPVDFRHQVGIYALYDEEFRLLYVGQAGSGRKTLFDRLKLHCNPRRRKDGGIPGLAGRWRYFSWFGLRGVRTTYNELAGPTKGRQTTEAHALNALEAVAIEIADPDLNRQGGSLPNDAEYLQVPAADKSEAEEC